MSEKINKEAVKEMFEVGAHYGYSKSRRHPSVSPYIFGAKDGVEIFDLEKVYGLVEEAKNFISNLGKEGKAVLFVGGKMESLSPIKDAAMSVEMPYVAGRWIGGTLTNFEEIRKRIERLNELTEKKTKGLLAGYTKRERLMIDREIEKLEKRFGGLEDMKRRPAALVVIDTERENIAVREAIQEGIPVVGIAGSDCDISAITYPIATNDSSITSITYFVRQLVDAYKKGASEKTTASSASTSPKA